MPIALWTLALSTLSAMTASALVFACARLLVRWARRLHPRARAWLWLLAASLPVWAGVLVPAAVLAPPALFGMPDHCLRHSDHHLHVCLAHGAPWPSIALVVLTALYTARVLGVVLQRVVDAARAERALRQLPRGSGGDVARLPMAEPAAFTAGWLAPRVYASAAVIGKREWRAVLAHERDHARHRDPLARLIARLGLAFHLPVVSGWIDRHLVAAQEEAADEAAASAIGDRVEVAAELVAWARSMRAPAPAGSASALDGGGVEARVEALLSARRYVSPPGGLLTVAVLLSLAVAAALLAPDLHHGVETLLGALGA